MTCLCPGLSKVADRDNEFRSPPYAADLSQRTAEQSRSSRPDIRNDVVREAHNARAFRLSGRDADGPSPSTRPATDGPPAWLGWGGGAIITSEPASPRVRAAAQAGITRPRPRRGSTRARWKPQKREQRGPVRLALPRSVSTIWRCRRVQW